MPPSTLKSILKGKIVIVGIGNPLRADDGFGPAFIEELQGKTRAVCLDVGSAPENYTGKIIKEDPDTILLVDALHLGGEPGTYEVITKDDILKSGMSTHDISAHMFIEYLEENCHADIYLLGVEPQNLTFGEEMSDALRQTLKRVSLELIEAENA